MSSITLNQALDQAVDQLRPLHKRVLKLRLRNKNYRNRLLDELAIKLHDDEECCALQLEGPTDQTMRSLLSEGDPETIYTFDPANLAKFLEIIIKYLPQLLAILLPLFTSILLPFLMLIPATATAQCVNCQQPNYTPQREVPTLAPVLPTATYSIVETQLPMFARMAVRAEGRQAARSVRQTGRGASYGMYPTVSGVASGGSTGTLSAGSTGTPVMLSYGSTGTPTYSLGSTGTPVTQTAAPVCTCSCPGCICNTQATTTVSANYVVTAPYVVATPRQSANYLIALKSATERARLGIKRHLLSIERMSGRPVGVGFHSSNPNPATCFNNQRGDYVSVRGRDGWYATKILH